MSVSPGRHPVRVLHLRDSPWVDGPGRTIIESGRHFDRERIDYHIGVFVGHPNQEHPMYSAACAHSLSCFRIVDGGGLDLRAVGQIVAVIDAHDIQVLHTSDLRSRVLGLLACIRRPRVRSITTVHGWIANTVRRRILRFLDKMLLRQSSTVVMVSDATRELVPRWWVSDDRVEIVRNALVLGEYGTGSADRPARGDGSPVRILNVGRLSREKGQDLLIRALACVVDEFPDIELSIAGVGPCAESLQSLARELQLTDCVKLLGYVADMPRLYAESDVLVQSSLTEGLPNVILEAAYLNLPIIATDVGGTREVVQDERSAMLIEPGSVQALSAAVRRFIVERQRFAAMTMHARERVCTEFSFETRTSRMTEIYEALVH